MDTHSDGELSEAGVENSPGTPGMSLHQAIEDSNYELVAELVYGGADLSKKDKKGNTALHLAAEKSSLNMTMLLLSKDAPVNALGRHGVTPLLLAARKYCLPVTKALVEGGAKYVPGLLRHDHSRAIYDHDQYIDSLRIIVTLGRDTDADMDSDQPLYRPLTKDVLDLMVWGGVNINVYDGDGQTPLNFYVSSHIGIGNGDVSYEVVQSLLQYGAVANDQDDLGGRSPLVNYVAGNASVYDPRIVDLFLRSGADELLVDDDGHNAAHYVDQNGLNEEILSLLANAPIDRRWRRRALIVMCIARHNRDFVPMKPIAVSANNPWSKVAAWLLEQGTDDTGIFRNIMGYL